MNVVFIIPTGIGCKIGGHAGDATPAAKLIAACCDKLVIHPNVVNASDINEMTDNMLYVEGSMLDRFLRGHIDLKEVYGNKILLAVNKPLRGDTINAVNAARHTIGADIEIVQLDTPFKMVAVFNEDGSASGEVIGHDQLCDQIKDMKFDALALHTEIEVPKDIVMEYHKWGGVNPWGGVEAKASKLIADAINKPVAHAPLERQGFYTDKEFVEIAHKKAPIPQLAVEFSSMAYLHCVLKGLHKAPRIGTGLKNTDINFMVSPCCWGRPHDACKMSKIPIIMVLENETIYNVPVRDDVIYVKNYLEAAGKIMAEIAGVF